VYSVHDVYNKNII